jgi:hypothetical protein
MANVTRIEGVTPPRRQPPARANPRPASAFQQPKSPTIEEDLMLMLARMDRMLTMAVVAVIVAGILLHVLDANAGNAVVSAIHDVSGWLVSPFKGLFSLDDNDLQIAVNWGIAALVYGLVGSFIATLLARAALDGEERPGWFRRRRHAAY